MDSYEFYKKGRDAAWKALIKSGASSLPVSLDKVAAAYKIDIISAKKAKEKGLINGNINDLKVISVGETRTVIVDERGSRGETRFLMAKGIGLCLLAKDRISREIEYEAVVFARDLLMPATVLAGLGVRNASDIEMICGVSEKAAEKRAKRREELYKRNRFNKHPLERTVRKNFEKFIINTVI